MGTYHWEGHRVCLMHICRVQSQVPFSGVCAHLRDMEKMGQAHTIEKLRRFAYKPLKHVITRVGVEALNQISEGDALLSKSQSVHDEPFCVLAWPLTSVMLRGNLRRPCRFITGKCIKYPVHIERQIQYWCAGTACRKESKQTPSND